MHKTLIDAELDLPCMREVLTDARALSSLLFCDYAFVVQILRPR